MIVVCKVEQCPYYLKNMLGEDGYCSRRVLGMTKDGMCSQIWKEGGKLNPFRFQPVDEDFKEFPIIAEEFDESAEEQQLPHKKNKEENKDEQVENKVES